MHTRLLEPSKKLATDGVNRVSIEKHDLLILTLFTPDWFPATVRHHTLLFCHFAH